MKHSNISLFVPHAGCPNQCSFCNQKTISGSVKELTKEEVRSTLLEAKKSNLSSQNTEIAFFGGSFTAIEREYMISLLEEAKLFLDDGTFSGIRISTRPDAIDREVLSILKEYGVTAIELGAQSTNDEVLLFNRRGHTKEDIINASLLIKEYGFSLGLQMMTGLYKSTDERDIETARDIISLSPDTVRIYPTIVLENTHLAELLKSGEYISPTLEATVSLCAKLLEMFNENNIKVIRLGLHSGGNVDEGYLSGPYHPAFGELCESEIYLKNIRKKLLEIYKNENNSEIKNVTIYVNEKEISKATGQKGKNKESLLSDGFSVTIKGLETIEKYQIIVEEN
ncbi:MAG: radical SAM protein [Ruminococcaceae bacterium]|nr:radical SAM protein [Oscillospiraceae bacterium]